MPMDKLFSSGDIEAGTRFKVVHNETGQYILEYKQGTFAKYPVFSCTPYSINTLIAICDIAFVNWGPGQPISVIINMNARDGGKPVDNGFQFMEFTTPSL